MCLIDVVEHPGCGHKDRHLLLACTRPKYSSNDSLFLICSQAKVHGHIEQKDAVGYECAICEKSRNGSQSAKLPPKREWGVEDTGIRRSPSAFGQAGGDGSGSASGYPGAQREVNAISQTEKENSRPATFHQPPHSA